MGLENGFEIKMSKEEFYKTKTYGIKPFHTSKEYVCVINWCHRWNLRGRIMRTLGFKDNKNNYEFQILEEFIPFIIKDIKNYVRDDISNKYYEDKEEIRWTKKLMRNSIKELKKLRKWMKHNPHIPVIFYNSY